MLTYDFEEERQFQSAFARLTSTGKLKRDPTERIEDPKIFLAHSLQTLSQRYPGKVIMFLYDMTFFIKNIHTHTYIHIYIICFEID